VVAAVAWFNGKRYFNIFAFSMGVKLNSNFYKIFKNANTFASIYNSNNNIK